MLRTSAHAGRSPAPSSSDSAERLALELAEVARVFGHDLREQLGLLSLNAQLVQKRHGAQLGPDGGRLLEQSATAVAQTHLLLSELIAYLRLRADGRPETGPADGAAALEGAVDDLAGVARLSGASILREPVPDAQAGGVHLREVFRRLLDNAIKFRGEKAPRVRVGGGTSGAMASYFVEDNGRGIDARHAGEVFSPLKRLNGFDYPGTGMGLTFCRSIVQLYGGSIWFDSVPGKGSVFHFTLPLAVSPR